ncbi:hypothetical protein [Oryzomonas rubra]|uniref:Uncharacterized protein n=1 Tax=Oryzomonas rubra TaxID=2509454 RepID=A0A5A9XEK4_9BACT|nr:hypothetical protein [Oryzomonas rubra]KAA0891416.1 hypothetical protein ET418_11595 [Oryzomonas rubra]
MPNKFLVAAVATALSLSAPVFAAPPTAAVKALAVNQLAAKPEAFVGKVTVVGRVAAATPGKGFTLIDSANCASCTTECPTDKTTKKIPFLWSGAAPVAKAVVKVDGTLKKTAKGYTFAAERVTQQ